MALVKRPGPLLIIAGILLFSAAVRLPILATEAFALDGSEADQPMTDPTPLSTGELDVLLAELRERERIIEEREAGLDAKAKRLASLQAKVSEKVDALNAAEQNLREVLAIADSAAEDDIARLTTVYENMKPKNAAEVFERMQPEFAAGFLAQMRPDMAASILAGLTPEAAYAISVVLAGRHVESGGQ